MPVNVDPIQAHALGAAPHVGKKMFKLFPSIADRNPSRAVIFIILVFGVSASSEHMLPNNKFWTSSSALPRVPMAHLAFESETSAGFGKPASQLFSRNNTLLSAITVAMPKNVMLAECYGFGDKPPKPLVYDIDGFGHRSLPGGCLSSGGIGACGIDPAAHSSTMV